MLTEDTIIHGLEVPNLDGLRLDELEDAQALFWALAEYANRRLQAKNLRAMGHLGLAKSVEDDLAIRHAKLPLAVRW